MKLAYILFDDLTMLDLIGMYDPISRLKSMGYLPDLEWHFCAPSQWVTDSHGLRLAATHVLPTLSGYDAIAVPGGKGTRRLVHDAGFIEWIRTGGKARFKVSVCTGSLLLGAAGLLDGKKATTHFSEYRSLAQYCQVIKEKLVHDGEVITAGAVAASLDMGLYLCQLWAGPTAREVIAKKVNYFPTP